MTKKPYCAHINDSGDIQTVEEHSTGTAMLCSQYMLKVNMEELGQVVGWLHDLGKNTELFNQYINSANGIYEENDDRYLNVQKYRGRIDHAGAGAQYVSSLSDMEPLIRNIISVLIRSHHGGLIDCLSPDGENCIKHRLLKDTKLTRLEESITNSEVLLGKISPDIQRTISKKYLEWLEFARSRYSKSVFLFMLGMMIRFQYSCLIDADRTDTADFMNPKRARIRQRNSYVRWEDLSDKLMEHLRSFDEDNLLNELRFKISKQCQEKANIGRGVFQLSVPTGGGKTLSSLRFALTHAEKHDMDRIIYVVPYTSIIDQNAQTIREILETQEPFGTVVLEHHSNLTPEEKNETTDTLSENWDAPIVFTTMVQLLECLFGGGTREVRRMHQLANSIIIFDEIQSLGIKFVYLFNTAMRFLVDHCEATVVLCTATQPLLNELGPEMSLPIPDKNRIVSEDCQTSDCFARVIADTKKIIQNYGELIDYVKEKRENGKSVLIILNTKKDVSKVAKMLKELHIDTTHLSTNMCPAHRLDRINNLKKALEIHREGRASPPVCVSTQLIEAGVDLDFDVVVRALAGLDSIIQAAGRCNRNGRLKEKGELRLVDFKNENLRSLKDIQIGKEVTERVLREFEADPREFPGGIIGENAIRQYYKYYFFQRENEMSYNIKLEDINRNDSIYSLLSQNIKSLKVGKEKIALPYSFASAAEHFQVIGGATQGVIVPFGKGKDIINRLSACGPWEISDVLQEAQQYSVNLYSSKFMKLAREGVINEIKGLGIFYLLETYYDENYGVVENSVYQDSTLII